MNGEEIKDIISLLENALDDLDYVAEMLIKLKILNKEYYDKAAKENEIYDII